MAMTTCKECDNGISTTAKACPKCGAVIPRPKVWPWIIATPVVVLVGLMMYGRTIPEYRVRADQVREACYKIAPSERNLCDANYHKAIAEGKASAQAR